LQVRYAGVEQVAYAPGELIIRLGEEPTETLQKLLDSWNAKIVGELPEIRAFLIRLDGQAISMSLYERAALTGFEYVERNYHVHSTFTPNDPLWSSEWGPRIVRADLAEG
jgi:hypothetical protein